MSDKRNKIRFREVFQSQVQSVLLLAYKLTNQIKMKSLKSGSPLVINDFVKTSFGKCILVL